MIGNVVFNIKIAFNPDEIMKTLWDVNNSTGLWTIHIKLRIK